VGLGFPSCGFDLPNSLKVIEENFAGVPPNNPQDYLGDREPSLQHGLQLSVNSALHYAGYEIDTMYTAAERVFARAPIAKGDAGVDNFQLAITWLAHLLPILRDRNDPPRARVPQYVFQGVRNLR